MTSPLIELARQRRLIALNALSKTADNIVSLADRRATQPASAVTFSSRRAPLPFLQAA